MYHVKRKMYDKKNMVIYLTQLIILFICTLSLFSKGSYYFGSGVALFFVVVFISFINATDKYYKLTVVDNKLLFEFGKSKEEYTLAVLLGTKEEKTIKLLAKDKNKVIRKITICFSKKQDKENFLKECSNIVSFEGS